MMLPACFQALGGGDLLGGFGDSSATDLLGNPTGDEPMGGGFGVSNDTLVRFVLTSTFSLLL